MLQFPQPLGNWLESLFEGVADLSGAEPRGADEEPLALGWLQG